MSRDAWVGTKHRGLGRQTGDGLGKVAVVGGDQDWGHVGLNIVGQVGYVESVLGWGICDEIVFLQETRAFTFDMNTLCQFTRNWRSLNTIFIFDESFLHVYCNSKRRFTYVEVQVRLSHETE